MRIEPSALSLRKSGVSFLFAIRGKRDKLKLEAYATKT